MKTQISQIVAPWMDTAIHKHGQGEKIMWETALMPVPSRPGAPPEPTLIVFVWFPGAVLGTVLNGSFSLNDPLNTSESHIDEVMADFLRQMREARSQQIEQSQTQSNGQGRVPKQPPGPQGPSGLIL